MELFHIELKWRETIKTGEKIKGNKIRCWGSGEETGPKPKGNKTKKMSYCNLKKKF